MVVASSVVAAVPARVNNRCRIPPTSSDSQPVPNDPATPSTDHSREYVPLLAAGPRVRPGVDLGTRNSFADVGATLAEFFGVGPLASGAGFLGAIRG